jgi:hypothetical protein
VGLNSLKSLNLTNVYPNNNNKKNNNNVKSKPLELRSRVKNRFFVWDPEKNPDPRQNIEFLPAFVRKYNAGLSFALLLLLFLGTH